MGTFSVKNGKLKGKLRGGSRGGASSQFTSRIRPETKVFFPLIPLVQLSLVKIEDGYQI